MSFLGAAFISCQKYKRRPWYFLPMGDRNSNSSFLLIHFLYFFDSIRIQADRIAVRKSNHSVFVGLLERIWEPKLQWIDLTWVRLRITTHHDCLRQIWLPWTTGYSKTLHWRWECDTDRTTKWYGNVKSINYLLIKNRRTCQHTPDSFFFPYKWLLAFNTEIFYRILTASLKIKNLSTLSMNQIHTLQVRQYSLHAMSRAWESSRARFVKV